MKYFLLFIGLFIYTGAILASFTIPIDDSLLFVLISIIAALLIVYNTGLSHRKLLTLTLAIVYAVILFTSLARVYNSINIHKNEYVEEADRIVIIPENFQGCIHILFPGGDSTFYPKHDTKDTITIDTFGLAVSRLTQLGCANYYDFYFVDSNRKFRKINVLSYESKPSEFYKKLPAIMYQLTEDKDEFYDYKRNTIYKKEIQTANFYLYNKDTCNCKLSTEGKNVDSVMTEYVKKMGSKKKTKRTTN